MAHNNALILDLSESSNNVEMWAKILRVWETITTHNLKERHLIVTDPNGCRIEITIPNNLIDQHYFGYFDEDQWRIFR
ncbi:hypothetical protein IGI04_023378 [Brassica rapa subsp. trilocularis]|uniref:Replication protein A 70 kDa DNA-binding subunit B/D first OB fold domain-containing protein n=2 Tax=Brassica TaxID=3705 RepID=A0ABQ7M694_BRACM|nr:hypothetical protein IGI04_023378 [Brassica rapa subsp. trilocularis]